MGNNWEEQEGKLKKDDKWNFAGECCKINDLFMGDVKVINGLTNCSALLLALMP